MESGAEQAWKLYPPSGTYEDLLCLLARAETRRYRAQGLPIPRRTALAALLELAGLPLGAAAAAALRALPAAAAGRLHDRLFAALSGRARLPFEAEAPQLFRARRLAERLESESGAPPALLCLMSHPPVTPQTLGLNVEIVRHALLALARLRPRPCQPRILAAVDPYALDALAALEQGAYAAFIGARHLGLDRLYGRRAAPGRLALSCCSWRRLPWRLERLLARREELALILSGGVPVTTRGLYALREGFAALRSLGNASSPRRVLEAVGRAEPDFAEFSRSGLVGARLRSNAWRMLEAWLLARMLGEWPAKGAERKEAYQGLLPADLKRGLEACARALGADSGRAGKVLERLEQEFQRETPYRERFFRFLAGRVVARGTPVLLLPLRHESGRGSFSTRPVPADIPEAGAGRGSVSTRPAPGDTPEPGADPGAMRLGFGEAEALLSSRSGRLRVARAGEGAAAGEEGIGEFAERFVRAHFP